MRAAPRNITTTRGIVEASGTYLLGQRSATNSNDTGKWEFLGGRPNPDESDAEALAREIHEEAGIYITPLLSGQRPSGNFVRPLRERDTGMYICRFFLVTGFSGEFDLDKNEVQEAAWFTPEQMLGLNMTDASRSASKHLGKFSLDATIELRWPPVTVFSLNRS